MEVINILHLFFLILLSSILGFVLFDLGFIGIGIAFGIIVGLLIWGIYQLEDTKDKIAKISKHLNILDEEELVVSDEEIERELERGNE